VIVYLVIYLILRCLLVFEHVDGISSNSFTQRFYGLQGEVPFSPLYTTHVGSVNADDVCEGFLAQALLLSELAQVGSEHVLKITGSHISSLVGCYL